MTTPSHFPFPTDMRNLWTNAGKDISRWHQLVAERLIEIAAVRVWREAAEADGWIAEATYDHESIDRAFKLSRDGFVIMGLTRPSDERSLGSGSLNGWAPDAMSIKLPVIYPGMEAIAEAAKTCYNCGNHPVETFRYSFAGRCCKDCLPEMQRIHERAGWCD